MSHAVGKVWAGGEVVGFFEYDGTSDYAIAAVWKTEEELWANWRSPAAERECACREPMVVDVELESTYGKGFTWPGKVCTACMTIVAGQDPRQDNE